MHTHDETQALIGHGILAHALFGFCAACPGRGPADEVAEWRAWGFMYFGAYLRDGAHPTVVHSTVTPAAVRATVAIESAAV